jgi:hypothetical protein
MGEDAATSPLAIVQAQGDETFGDDVLDPNEASEMGAHIARGYEANRIGEARVGEPGNEPSSDVASPGEFAVFHLEPRDSSRLDNPRSVQRSTRHALGLTECGEAV